MEGRHRVLQTCINSPPLNKHVAADGEERWEGMDRESGAGRGELLYIEWINKMTLLYSTGNYIQYPVINCNGNEYFKKNIYICMYNLITAVQKKLTQHCKSAIFLFFKAFFFWLCKIFVAVPGLSLVAAGRGSSLVVVRGLLVAVASLGQVGSVAVLHRPGGPVACGISLDQGLSPCTLHWQADTQPLDHQGNS